MRTAARTLGLAAILASMSTVASGYYHWTYYVSRSAPFVPISAKFDLTVLQDRTVSYFISDKPPSTLVANDNYDSLLSQIQFAAKTWNGVASSRIRLQFGGISTVGTPQAAPGIDVVFDDNMPPGLFAQTTVTTPSDLTYLNGADPTKALVPILRSRLQLRSDLTVYQQASFSDTFFMTIVHEFGHTVGLQHSETSATMATSLTRGTSKALPLSTDDVAAISLLYPAPGFAQSTGSITGQVQVAGRGVSLASVVALSANGTAIGGMTNPDGTYRIDGVPPGDYYVYAHPLPPAQQGEFGPAAIFPPVDPSGAAFPIDTSFDTQFFPGTHLLSGASQVSVAAAASTNGINFNLASRPAGSPIYDMQMYAFLGPAMTAVQAAPLVSGDRRFLAFTAPGLLIPNTTTLVAGLSVSVMGSAAQFEAATLANYTQGFLLIVVDTNAVAAPTPVAVVVNTPTDLYVLPAAFSVVPSQGPAITSVSGSTDALGNATATISGTNLSANMRFLFDGSAASGITVNADATLTMTAPPATGAHVAAVEALASDGQTSSEALGTALPPTFTYAAPNNPFLTVTPANFLAGTDTMVEIDGFNTNFIDGESTVGFGSSDIVVRRVWVTGPGRILMNISVSPAAAIGPVTATVATGLQLVTLTSVVHVQPPNPQPMSLRAPVLDADTNLPGVSAGGVAVFGTSGLPANLRGWMLTIDGTFTGYLNTSNLIYAFVLGAVPPGPTVVQLIAPPGVAPVPPILMQVDGPPPAILSALAPDGTRLDDSDFIANGDVITLIMARLGNTPNTAVSASRVLVTVGGVPQTLTSLTPPNASGISQIQFALTGGFPDGSQQVISVQVFSRQSEPYRITLVPAPASP